jgi:hypothetical protein
VVNAASARGTGQIPDKEDLMYVVTRDELYLVPTAEVPVTNLHRDEIFEADQLPIRYAAYSPCFRREAGAAGKDTRGILRVHQFDKVEMVFFEKPEASAEALEWLTGRAEVILQRLGLAYRVLLMATKDMGFVQAKKYDLEVWAPGVERWLEVSSCSNFRDYQARRMAIRYRPEPGAKPELVHTLNGSGLALPERSPRSSRRTSSRRQPGRARGAAAVHAVSGISDAAATKMNGAIADKINAYIGAFTGGSLPAVAGGAGPSTLEGDFSIALDSPTLLSLRFTVLTHVSGSANMAEEPGSINFAVSSGATINLADLFSDQAKALSTVTAAVKVDLNAQLGTDLTWDGKASSLSFYDKAWAMTPTGLEVAFAQGSMASAAAGMPTSTIPWSALKSVVKPDSPAGEFVK